MLKLTGKQIYTYIGEAQHYNDRNTFAGDIANGAYDAAEFYDDLDKDFVEQCARLWDIARIPFRELISKIGITQSDCSRRFLIPLRTLSHWCSSGNDQRECPVYIRLMIAELTGYFSARA